MKCCNSGLGRRIKASNMLYSHIKKLESYQDRIFIVLGDWNDDLKDDDGEHCFQSFIDDPIFYFRF